MSNLVATASQTIGPYWHLIEHPEMADLTRFGATGEVIVLSGRITDGDGAPVADACVEIWQADPPAADNFPGYGRARSDADGAFRFTTIKPGPVPLNGDRRGNTQQAPHIAITIFARGLMKALVTRAYFAGEALNDTDPVLGMIEEPARRASLIAARTADGWRLDIRLQGADETVFLDI
jgi:protocatechuate 3,4-dioxygenase alpha subunit